MEASPTGSMEEGWPRIAPELQAASSSSRIEPAELLRMAWCTNLFGGSNRVCRRRRGVDDEELSSLGQSITAYGPKVPLAKIQPHPQNSHQLQNDTTTVRA